jgi:HPt (histidine-containing phosphotransfer) domain-containing protein
MIDENQIKTIFEIDRSGELFRRLLAIFENDIPKMIIDLEHCLKEQDFDNAKKISHSIKSSALNMGARELAKMAADVETSDLYKNHDTSVVMDFKKCFEYSVTELRGYLNLCKT